MKLTEMEKDVIIAICENEFSDSPGDPVWSWAVHDKCKITKQNQICGVISSLIKKGLAVSDEWDGGMYKDQTVELTKKGVEIYHKLKR